MQIQITMMHYLIPVRRAVFKRQEKTSVKMWGKGNSCILAGNANCTATLESSYVVFSEN